MQETFRLHHVPFQRNPQNYVEHVYRQYRRGKSADIVPLPISANNRPGPSICVTKFRVKKQRLYVMYRIQNVSGGKYRPSPNRYRIMSIDTNMKIYRNRSREFINLNVHVCKSLQPHIDE